MDVFNIPDSLLFDEVPCYISVQDRNCKILKANKKFRTVFGNRIGDYCYAVYKQRDSICDTCLMMQTFQDGKQHTSEEMLFSPEGYPIYVKAQTSPLFNDEGEVIAVIEMSTDITENKRLQSKLEESNYKYRMLYDDLPCFITLQDKNFKIVESNKKFRDEFGYGRGEFCYNVYKHRTERCEVCPVAETYSDGQIHTSEEIVSGKGGNPINVLVLAAPIRDASGEITSVMELSTDITHIRQMQSRLTNVGQLVAGLAHTIKGIITGLDGGMYVVESGFKNKREETVKQGWEIVQRNIDRVSHLVLDMLYYAKDRIPEIKELNVKSICDEILKLYQIKFSENSININVDYKVDGLIVGDSKSVYTMILNLVENAIHACSWDKSKTEHNIQITIDEEGNKVVFKIKDDGYGMSQEVQDKLFTPLFSTKGSQGSGFGLMVVKKIVDEHSGEIIVNSKEKEGTEFNIKLPKSNF